MPLASRSAFAASPDGTPWWRDAVIYQVYLRSFADANGDGIGDLAGLRSRLDYLADLGVDGLWLNPCYPSPQADHGYDVADYTDIEPAYGDLAAMDALIADAHSRGLRVLMDLVPNHCSSAHPWFRAALTAAPGSPERGRFIFRPGRGPDGELPPNNWPSVFGGPAWTRVTEPDGTPGEWYLHLFDTEQPDFDWRNPQVQNMFDDVLRFWFDRGVDGFRIDVAHGLYKHADLPDWTSDHYYNGHAWNQPEVHEVHRRWHRIAASYAPDRELTLVGEIWVPEVTDLAAYLRPDELQQAFFFDLLMQPWDAAGFRASIDRAFTEIGSTGAAITWTLSNHDVHRATTRYGIVHPEEPHESIDLQTRLMRPRGEVDTALGERRARAAALLLLALPGTQYLYQGEELGLPEVLDLPDDARQDPTWFRSDHNDPGRDGSRVPLPWTTRPGDFGFSGTDEPTAAPWLPQPTWFAKYAAAEQAADAASTLSMYRHALRVRRTAFPGTADTVTWLDVPEHPNVLAFRRSDVTCVVAFGTEPLPLPGEWGEVLAASDALDGRMLPGGTAAWLRHPAR
ncbi:glycoside hydrolase family 13 protein [Streptomyces sp. NBC_01537]|uniref:glycoside hydrolase family 13 protein n=1 Tax=Streptomyces sp. NBC_01537 TaxID=2903896 RepID=UPI00386CC4DA